jgi:UDP-N-acetylglucosamine 2-epimerase (non-hydrolysing)
MIGSAAQPPFVELIAGLRPNFVKPAPVVRALRCLLALDVRVLHTGQHCDASMSEVFCEELGMPWPPEAAMREQANRE